MSLRWNGGRQQRVSPSLICFITRPVLKGPTLQQNNKKKRTKQNKNKTNKQTTKQTKQIIRLRNLIDILLLLIFVYGLKKFLFFIFKYA